MTEVAQKWLDDQKTKLESEVVQILNSRREEIVCKLLGFNKRYGNEWELDHCNGRAGQSEAGQLLASKIQPTVRAWLEQQAGKMPKLPAEAIAALKKDYVKGVLDEIRRELYSTSHQEAKRILEGFKIAFTLGPSTEPRRIELKL